MEVTQGTVQSAQNVFELRRTFCPAYVESLFQTFWDFAGHEKSDGKENFCHTFLSPPVLMHGGLLCIAFCLSESYTRI